MNIDTKIQPLIQDIEKLNLKEFLKSSAFNRFMIKEGLDKFWAQAFEQANRENRVIAIGMDTKGYVCKNALNIFINYLYQTDVNDFFYFIAKLIFSFKENTDTNFDLTDIILDLELLSPPQDIVEILRQIGGKSEENKISKMKNKSNKTKIFISHAASDKLYVEKLVSLFEHIGLTKDDMFCSSIPEYGIPLESEDIFEYLKEEFQKHELYVIFVLSKNYYNSYACLNEMGAAWILQSKYQSILLPNFSFSEIGGAINPRKICFKLNDIDERKVRINQLKDSIIQKLELKTLETDIWERHRDIFFKEVDAIIIPKAE